MNANETTIKLWPNIKSKVKFKGTSKWFFFQNILKDANDLLEIDKEYTIASLEIASSWCAVILEEFPNKKFSLSWFTYEKDLTTEEVMQLEKERWETVRYEFVSLKELIDRTKK